MNAKIDYRDNYPQTVRGVGGVQTFEFVGHCAVCNARLFAGVSEDKSHYDPDPRGFIDERHARVTLTPDRTGKSGAVFVCYSCANNAESYHKACLLAEVK